MEHGQKHRIQTCHSFPRSPLADAIAHFQRERRTLLLIPAPPGPSPVLPEGLSLPCEKLSDRDYVPEEEESSVQIPAGERAG